MPDNVRLCFFCKDTDPNHHHWTVLCYEDGKCLGRLTGDGHATRRKIFAVMLTEARAKEIAQEINAEGTFTAKARRF